MSEENRPHAKKIAIFNHKGGVGKTTLTVNIATALVEQGKKVLCVDTDPQCNLTSYMLDDPTVDLLLDESDDASGRTIWSALKPISEDVGDFRLIEPIERPPAGLFLLPGDIQLSAFEEDLPDKWRDCLSRKIRGYRSLTAISRLIDTISARLGIDFVFFDSGPNIGLLNRIILLDCDYLIVPAACDVFSVRALKTLGKSLSNWIRDWDTIMLLAPEGFPLLRGKPHLLGYIPQGFRVYGDDISYTFKSYIPKIERSLYTEVIVRLLDIDPTLASRTMAELKLGQIKNFGSLATDAQNFGSAMWTINGAPPYQKAEAKKAFSAIARRIIAARS